jgi:hypothetical protein
VNVTEKQKRLIADLREILLAVRDGERERIIAWLRAEALRSPAAQFRTLHRVVHALENGDHLNETDATPAENTP